MSTAAATAATRRRVLAASFVGTTVEYYDFYLYATASALIFAPQFFPEVTPAVGVILSFATYGVGFVARPLGGVIAGHFGDRVGRKRLLVLSLVLMGVASTLIGVLPNAASIGVWAVVGLVTLRLVQGLAAGAEWGGSALLSSEHAPAGRRSFFGSFTQLGSAGGMLLSTGVFVLVHAIAGDAAFSEWAWRIPFLASALLVAVGLVIRLRVTDAPEFTALVESEAVERRPLLVVLRTHRRSVLVLMGLRLAQPALYSILTVYTLSYIASVRGDTTSGTMAVLIASAFSLISTPAWAWLSDRVGRRPIAIGASIGIGVLIWPYFLFLNAGPLVLLPVVVVLLMSGLHDAIYGPQAGWFTEQFPVGVRYSGVSLGYQFGSIFSVGLTPLLAAVFFVVGGGTPWLLCTLVGAFAVLSIIAAVFAKDSAADSAVLRRREEEVREPVAV